MAKRNDGLFILHEQINSLKKRVEANDPNKKEGLKVAKERAKASALTLFAVNLISLKEKEIIDDYINGLADGTLTEEIRLQTFNLFEDMIKESEVQ